MAQPPNRAILPTDDFPPARSNPEQEQGRVDHGSLHSYRFIQRFATRDTAPVVVTNPTTQLQRNAQIVALTRRLLSQATTNLSDAQVLRLYRDYAAGRF